MSTTVILTAGIGKGAANRPTDVRTVQSLLNKYAAELRTQSLKLDGIAGPKTISTIELFQRRVVGLSMPDGRVDPGGRTFRALASTAQEKASLETADVCAEVPGAERSKDWPPRPGFQPLVSNKQRENLFGKFEYVPDTAHPGSIKILGDWEKKNIVAISLDMGPAVNIRRVHCHRLVATQMQKLWSAWKGAGVLDRILTYDGLFVPRYVRGSTETLSNHAFGSAFDINYEWNKRKRVPALLGDEGCVRELVPIANDNGFFWGGHFAGHLMDGMHFEVARIM
jgi:hypothetical protein